jgi:nicotinamidase-related amidase
MEALLLIDIQNDYFRGGLHPLAGMDKAARNAKSLLEEFRVRKLPVIHVRHEGAGENAGFFRPNTKGAEIHELVRPLPGETVLVKHFPSSFRDTGLDAILKNLGVDTIHVAGAMTNMCVDTTTRAGFDLGYRMILHENACAARGYLGTRIVHRITVKTLGSAFAEIAE